MKKIAQKYNLKNNGIKMEQKYLPQRKAVIEEQRNKKT